MNRFSHLRRLLLIAVLVSMSGIVARAQCPGTLGPWLYRVPITINNPGAALSNYFLLVKVNTSLPISQSKMRSDGGDVRFADASCNLQNFWLQNGINTSTTNYWVKLGTLPSGSSTWYMYYGNSTATRTNQVSDVFGNGLVALYTFTEGSGATLTDWVNNFNLAVTCTWTTGFRANVGALTGFSSGRAFLAGNGPSIGTGSFTAIDYFNATSVSGSTAGIIGNYNNDGANGWVHKLQGGAGQFMLLSNQGGGWCQSSVGTLTANVWKMSGVRRTSGTGDQGLQDGAPTGALFCAGDNRNVDGSGPFEIGHSYNGSYPFPGSISMSLVYNVALSDGEVSALHNSIYANPEPVPTINAEESVTPPVITQQPVSQAVCQGATVTFTVAATGPSLTYQWRKNTVPILGATGTSYTIVNVQPADFGSYDCVVRSQVTTNPATLTVYTPPAVAASPANQTVCPGQTVTFNASGSGSGLTFQWRRNGANIPGATTSSYVIPAATSSDNGTYDAAISGTCGGPVYTGSATFTLRVPPTIQSITSDQTVCRGQIATFSVSAIGEAITYQWRKDGVPLDGATKPTLTIMAQPYSEGNYSVVVAGACDPVAQSAPIHLTVNLDPIITEQPLDQTIGTGATVTYRVKVIGGGIITYQWYKDGVLLPGRNHDTLIVQNATTDNIGEYYCVVKGTVCSDRELVVSDKAALILDVPPSIVKNPQDETVCEGSSVTLSVTAAGLGLRYQWRKAGVNIPGATGRDLTLDNTLPGDAGSYDCVITAPGNGTLTTSPATVTVNQPASIATHPADATVCPGTPATFNVAANGVGVTYQWRKNGVDIPGATNAALTISSAAAADTGSYTVAIDGSCLDSALESNSARLILNALPAITSQPQPALGVPKNGTVTLVVTATGTNLTYQWYKDGVAIPGATTATYAITSAQPEQSGRYNCVVTGLCSPVATSDTVQVDIKTSGVANDPVTTGAMLTVLPQPAAGLTKLIVRAPQGVALRSGTELGLYDVKGQLVLNLSEAFEHGSFQTAEFNAAVLPSGTYYCRLTSGSWNGTLGTVMVVK